MKILAIFLSVIVTLAADERPLPKVKHMIDTHIHLYDPTREEGIPWPPKDATVLYKPAAHIEGSKRRAKSSHEIWPRHGCSCATAEVRPKRPSARSQVGVPRVRSCARRRAPGAHPGQ